MAGPVLGSHWLRRVWQLWLGRVQCVRSYLGPERATSFWPESNTRALKGRVCERGLGWRVWVIRWRNIRKGERGARWRCPRPMERPLWRQGEPLTSPQGNPERLSVAGIPGSSGEWERQSWRPRQGPGSLEPMHHAKAGSLKHGEVLGQGVTALGSFGDNHSSSLVRRRRWGRREMEGWAQRTGSRIDQIWELRVYGDEGGSLGGWLGSSRSRQANRHRWKD